MSIGPALKIANNDLVDVDEENPDSHRHYTHALVINQSTNPSIKPIKSVKSSNPPMPW